MRLGYVYFPPWENFFLAIGKIKQNKKQSQQWWTCQEETVTTTKQGVGGEKSIELIKYKINHVL